MARCEAEAGRAGGLRSFGDGACEALGCVVDVAAESGGVEEDTEDAGREVDAAIRDAAGWEERDGVCGSDGVELCFAVFAIGLEEAWEVGHEAVDVAGVKLEKFENKPTRFLRIDTVSKSILPITAFFSIWPDDERIDVERP